jgi:hypothetical protein
VSDRRNPYLILGIDHGADATQASAAFARATRRLRNHPGPPYTIEDLTWALHRIEQRAQIRRATRRRIPPAHAPSVPGRQTVRMTRARPPMPWTAPTATEPVRGTVRLPGSKSMTARALVLSALSEGPSTVRAPLRARDTELMAADCDGNLCLSPVKGAKWESGVTTSPKERTKRSKKNGGTLSISIEDGRGSVFINGRYAGTAPLSGIEIPRGRNDIQVRDGAEVLASGVLQVPANADLDVTVTHP